MCATLRRAVLGGDNQSMQLYGRLAWYRLCACFDCGNVPKSAEVYRLRRRRQRQREKRQWMREELAR